MTATDSATSPVVASPVAPPLAAESPSLVVESSGADPLVSDAPL